MNLGDYVVLADSLRAYIKVRRDLFGYTQERFEKTIGTPYPTYRDYEGGATKDLKASAFARAVDVLNIPSEHIKVLAQKETGVEEAARLANEQLQARAEALADSVPVQERLTAVEFVRQLRSDPALLRELRELLADDAQRP